MYGRKNEVKNEKTWKKFEKNTKNIYSKCDKMGWGFIKTPIYFSKLISMLPKALARLERHH